MQTGLSQFRDPLRDAGEPGLRVENAPFIDQIEHLS